MRTIAGQPSEDTQLISQTEQRDTDALLQTTNPFPETLHNAQRTSIRQSCSTMHNTNSHLPPFVVYCYQGGKTLPMPNPHLTASSIKGCARKMGRKTMVTNARWTGAVSSAKLPVSIIVPTPSIFFTCCHLSLSTYGGRKYADLQPWHFVMVS